MYLKCNQGDASVVCIDEASKTKKEGRIPGSITELTIGNTYTCTIKGSDDSAITFKPGNQNSIHTLTYKLINYKH